jgi:hypothetical protein
MLAVTVAWLGHPGRKATTTTAAINDPKMKRRKVTWRTG